MRPIFWVSFRCQNKKSQTMGWHFKFGYKRLFSFAFRIRWCEAEMKMQILLTSALKAAKVQWIRYPCWQRLTHHEAYISKSRVTQMTIQTHHMCSVTSAQGLAVVYHPFSSQIRQGYDRWHCQPSHLLKHARCSWLTIKWKITSYLIDFDFCGHVKLICDTFKADYKMIGRVNINKFL